MRIIVFKNITDLVNQLVFKLKPAEFVEFNKKIDDIRYSAGMDDSKGNHIPHID